MCLLSILVGDGASLITDGVILRDWTNMAFGCDDHSGQQALEGDDTNQILLLIDDWISFSLQSFMQDRQVRLELGAVCRVHLQPSLYRFLTPRSGGKITRHARRV
jgi:hypothetical protein